MKKSRITPKASKPTPGPGGDNPATGESSSSNDPEKVKDPLIGGNKILAISGCVEACPFDIITQFLRAIVTKDYRKAMELCKTILQYEPDNRTMKEYEAVLKQFIEDESNGPHSSSSESESESTSSGEESASKDSTYSTGEEEEEEEQVVVSGSGNDDGHYHLGPGLHVEDVMLYGSPSPLIAPQGLSGHVVVASSSSEDEDSSSSSEESDSSSSTSTDDESSNDDVTTSGGSESDSESDPGNYKLWNLINQLD